MTDFLLFSSIRDYIYARITYFAEYVLSENLTLALTVILTLITLWVMVQGCLIATGRSSESLKGFVSNLAKTYIIVSLALGAAGGGSFGVRTMTETLSDGISQIMTGDTEAGKKCLLQNAQTVVGCKIDQNLSLTQSMMGVLAGIDTADNDHLESKLTEARWFAGIGTAGPAIVAGGMLIMFRIAMALFIGFAPIFILCLLFKKTAPLFQKWLYYGLATIFSGVLLGVMADISMDLVANIAASSAITEVGAMILTGEATAGIMQTVTQQLGLGLLLSVLLITVPPMAGAFFNGVMSNYSGWNAFSGWSGGQASVPPHIDGGRSMNTQNVSYQQPSNQQVDTQSLNYRYTTQSSDTNHPTSDGIKKQSSINGIHPASYVASESSDRTKKEKRKGS